MPLPTPLPRSRDDSTVSRHQDNTSVTLARTCLVLFVASRAAPGSWRPPCGYHASVALCGDTHIKQSVAWPPLETQPRLVPVSGQVCALPEGFHRVVPLRPTFRRCPTCRRLQRPCPPACHECLDVQCARMRRPCPPACSVESSGGAVWPSHGLLIASCAGIGLPLPKKPCCHCSRFGTRRQLPP